MATSLKRLVPLVWLLSLSGCAEEQVITATRNLARPGPMTMVCATRSADVTRGLPASECRREKDSKEPQPSGTLYGFVANTSRGDVAFFRASASGEPLVDLEPKAPGFGFIPVGSLTTDIKTTQDGCRVVTANSGSCDLAVLDVPAVLDTADGRKVTRPVVRRVVPKTAAGPLRARPQEIAIVKASLPTAGDPSCTSTESYRAYVTFPRCNLLAEIDLKTGMVVRALRFSDNKWARTDDPSCPAECPIRGEPSLVDSGTNDSLSTDDAAPKPDVAIDATLSDAQIDAAQDAKVIDAARDAKVVDAAARDATLDAGMSDAVDAAAATDGTINDVLLPKV